MAKVTKDARLKEERARAVHEKQDAMKAELLEIATLLGEASSFCVTWFFMNDMIKRADEGDPAATEIVNVVKRFGKLVKISQGGAI